MANTTTSFSPLYDAPRYGSGPVRSFGEIAMGLVDTLLMWREQAGQRRLLAAADDRLLGDLGIGRGETAAETAKPFWRG
jgi:uncharacterized protein YjiS (DUF1127 family)